MSYSLFIQDIHAQQYKIYKNLTEQAIMNEPRLLEKTDHYTHFKEDNPDSSFKESDNWNELCDTFIPINNYVHVLQKDARTEDILDIYEHAPHVSILNLTNFETHVISITSYGIDISDSVAYAYLKIDKHIPKYLIPNQKMTISQIAWDKIQEYLKSKA